MIRSDYDFYLHFWKEDGAPIGQLGPRIDWGPATECAWFTGFRRGQLDAADCEAPAIVVPHWHPTAGAPFMQGFRLQHARAGEAPAATTSIECDFPNAYFRELAQATAATFVQQGKLLEGDKFHYLVAAYRFDRPPDPEPRPALALRAAHPELPVAESSLENFIDRATPVGAVDPGDPVVFVPESVLEETAALTRVAGSLETGGVLLGHLHRSNGDVFVEVTAQVPARHTEATSTRLTFTPETWSDLRAVIRLRRRGEIFAGWWHSHPIFEFACKACPAEKQARCALADGFLSDHDRVLHRTVFSRAYTTALVVTHMGTGELRHALFGWRHGLVGRRGYQVLGSRREGVAP